MKVIKKAGRFLSSMQFAIGLLAVLILSCIGGSLITQGQVYDWYARRYSERAAGAIIALHLDDVFHSWWFLLIAVFLCVNLLCCNLLRLPQVIRRWKRMGKSEGILSLPPLASVRVREPSGELFRRMGFRTIREETGETRLKVSCRGRAGVWGAWVCHLGILLLILGFGLGQSLKKEYTVYGVPGQSKEIGETGYVLTIDDFRTDKNADGSVAQYTAELTVRDVKAGRSESGTASVNAPASLFGMKFYQNSTGWAAETVVLKDGNELQREVLSGGELLAVKDKPELVIYLNAVYPDYVLMDGTPMSQSDEVKNPAYLYSVYYQGSLIGMNALMDGEELTIDEYTVLFSNPQPYTLIQVKRDPFTPLAFLGGLVTMLGLILALYVQPAGMWAVEEADGSWTVRIASRKGGEILAERFRELSEAEEPVTEEPQTEKPATEESVTEEPQSDTTKTEKPETEEKQAEKPEENDYD